MYSPKESAGFINNEPAAEVSLSYIPATKKEETELQISFVNETGTNSSEAFVVVNKITKSVRYWFLLCVGHSQNMNILEKTLQFCMASKNVY